MSWLNEGGGSAAEGRGVEAAPEAPVIVGDELRALVARHWWERILYNQSSSHVRRALLGRPNTVVTNVPYRREEPAAFERHPEAAEP